MWVLQRAYKVETDGLEEISQDESEEDVEREEEENPIRLYTRFHLLSILILIKKISRDVVVNNVNSLQSIKDEFEEDANLIGDRNKETEKSLFDNDYELKEDCDQEGENFLNTIAGSKEKI